MDDPGALLPQLARIASRAGEIALELRQPGKHELKADGSIVTASDRGVEEYLRKELPRLVPQTAVYGEEYGHSEPGPNGLWVVDPVDGTSNFAFGSPLWGVSVALIQGDEVVLGCIHLPDLNEVYLAAKDGGATLNGQPLRPIPPGPIKDEELVSYNDHVLRALEGQAIPGKMRLSGAVVVDGAFVARQRYRGMIGVREKLYDIGAAVIILKELGADVRYADGEPMSVAALAVDRKIDRPWIAFPRDSGFFAHGRV